MGLLRLGVHDRLAGCLSRLDNCGCLCLSPRHIPQGRRIACGGTMMRMVLHRVGSYFAPQVAGGADDAHGREDQDDRRDYQEQPIANSMGSWLLHSPYYCSPHCVLLPCIFGHYTRRSSGRAWLSG